MTPLHRLRWTFAASLVTAVCLRGFGCVSSKALSSRAVNYNVAAETARNQMLLLNILRARDRKPMTFTGLSRITGSVRSSAGVGASGRVGGGADSVSVLPNASVTDAPTFDVAVLNSQEFTRGIMTPLGFDLVEYFWDQGFTREVLLYLVTERLEVDCGGEDLTALINDPEEPSWEAFRQAINDLSDTGRWRADEFRSVIGPPVPEAQATSLPTLIQVAGSRLEIRPVGDGTWQLERAVTTRRLRADARAVCGPADRDDSPIPVDFYESKDAFDRASPGSDGPLRGRVVPRSPQSILFFLGELTRPGKGIYIRERRPDQPLVERRLFHIATAEQCSEGTVSVDYFGQTYVVPNGNGACNEGRALQSLALTAQLLALQQSSRDLPVTNTVRIVGQ